MAKDPVNISYNWHKMPKFAGKMIILRWNAGKNKNGRRFSIPGKLNKDNDNPRIKYYKYLLVSPNILQLQFFRSANVHNDHQLKKSIESLIKVANITHWLNHKFH